MTGQSGYVLDGYSLVDKTFTKGMTEAVGRHFFIVKDFEVSFKLLMNGLAGSSACLHGSQTGGLFLDSPGASSIPDGFDEIVVHRNHTPLTALSGGVACQHML